MFAQAVLAGRRPPPLPLVPSLLHALLAACWRDVVDERPQFASCVSSRCFRFLKSLNAPLLQRCCLLCEAVRLTLSHKLLFTDRVVLNKSQTRVRLGRRHGRHSSCTARRGRFAAVADADTDDARSQWRHAFGDDVLLVPWRRFVARLFASLNLPLAAAQPVATLFLLLPWLLTLR